MEVSMKVKSFAEDVRIERIIYKDYYGTSRGVGAVGWREDTDEKVFISGKCVSGVSLKEDDVVRVEMVPNDKYLAGQTDCKYYGFYIHSEEEKDPEQLNIEDWLAESGDGDDDGPARKRRTEVVMKAKELMGLGGVWSGVRLFNSVTGSSFSDRGEMSEEQQRILTTLEMYMAKMHNNGEACRIDVRRKGDQKRPSHVFYTTKPDELVEALRRA